MVEKKHKELEEPFEDPNIVQVIEVKKQKICSEMNSDKDGEWAY